MANDQQCRCYWCNLARGMSKEKAQAENDRMIVEKSTKA